MISTFNVEKENLDKNYLLTPTQKEWISARSNIVKMKPLKTSFYRKKPLYRFVTNKYFEIFILVCIILNIIVLALNWYRRPEEVATITEFSNYLFTIIFTIEVIIKILGLGLRRYFSDGSNIFDFAIIIGSYVGPNC